MESCLLQALKPCAVVSSQIRCCVPAPAGLLLLSTCKGGRCTTSGLSLACLASADQKSVERKHRQDMDIIR
jgi:hypothetical protein